ncbi:MAG: hypothetical protein HQL84_07400 [Magnetococcales bacterium]|nr:hypothetical protein [Magnetococcales bacterium]MBF0149856.1 hypothetical protein [Magnetococcales bacterium]
MGENDHHRPPQKSIKRFSNPYGVATKGIGAFKLANGGMGESVNVLYLAGGPESLIFKPFTGKGDASELSRGLFCIEGYDFHGFYLLTIRSMVLTAKVRFSKRYEEKWTFAVKRMNLQG